MLRTTGKPHKLAGLLMAMASVACSGSPGEATDHGAVSAHSTEPELAPEGPFVAIEPVVTRRASSADDVTAGLHHAASMVRVEIRGDVAKTVVTEVYDNPTAAPLPLEYSFPLPGDATIAGFADFREGKRREAALETREAARGKFERAKAAGETAALTETDEDRGFRMALSPVAAGESRRVELSYVQSLRPLGTERSFVLPAQLPDGSVPGVFELDLDITGTKKLSGVTCPNHPEVRVVRLHEKRQRVHLSLIASKLDRDLVCRFSEAAEPLDLAARAVRTSSEEPGFVEARFAFTKDPARERREPRDFVFVLDTSLSMAGDALERSKQLVERTASHLDASDRVALVSFDASVRSWSGLAPADDATRRRLLDEVRALSASGPSNLDAAIDVAAELVAKSPRAVVVLSSDGQGTVGGDLERLTPASSPEAFRSTGVFIALFNYPSRKSVLTALFPNVTTRYVPNGAAGENEILQLSRLAAAPTIEGLKVSLDGIEPGSQHGTVPEVLALGDSVRVLGRANGPVTVRVTGTLYGKPVERTTHLESPTTVHASHLLPIEWARLRIADLERAYQDKRDPLLRDQMGELSKRYHLVSSAASLVATEDSLSPDRIMPGDPELRVHAPENAGSVFAVLPWGERVDLTWSDREKLWFGRFLVPRATPDGLHRARVYVESQGLVTPRTTLLFRVDSKPPEFELLARRRDARLVFEAVPKAHVFDADASGVRMDLLDVESVHLKFEGSVLPMSAGESGHFFAEVSTPGGRGAHAAELVAKDYAGNLFIAKVVIGTDGTATRLEPHEQSASKMLRRDGGAPVRCDFARGPRLAEITTEAGERVELYEQQLRLGGAVWTPCDRLPAPHPVAIARFGTGFAVAFRDAGFALWDGSSLRLLAGPPNAQIRALASAADTLWLGTAGRGLWRYRDGKLNSTEHTALKGKTITALAIDRAGDLHVGTDPSGHWTLSASGSLSAVHRSKSVGCFEERLGRMKARAPGNACASSSLGPGTLPSGHITALAPGFTADRIFAGTLAGGVFTLDEEGNAEAFAGAPRYVNALLATPVGLFIGATDGLFRLVPGHAIEQLTIGSGAPHVNGLAPARDGGLWVATSSGVANWKDGEFTWLDQNDALPSSIVYAVAQTPDDTLWIGTAKGLVRLEKGTVTQYDAQSGTLAHNWVTALLTNDDGVYVGTYNSGVVHFDSRGSRPSASLAHVWVNPHGLAMVSGELVAAGLGDGMVAEHGENWRKLPSDDVTSIVEHGRFVWVGTRAGIARIRRR